MEYYFSEFEDEEDFMEIESKPSPSLPPQNPFAHLYAKQVEAARTTDRMIGTSILHRVPPEIFAKICSSLEPVWLTNLSTTCYAMTVKLSLESGNRIWYDAMPPTMWRESEHYQDEDELWTVWMRQTHPELFCPRDERLIGMDDCQFLGIPGDAFPTNVPCPKTSRQNIKQNNTPSCSAEALIAHSNKAAGCGREMLRCLGGAYQPFFNYRREILGRLRTRAHCYLCMATKDIDGHLLKCWMWNMLICPDCVKEWTVSEAAIRELRIEALQPASDHVCLVPHEMNGVRKYFRPEIDEALRIWTCVDFATNVGILKERRHVKNMKRLEQSGLEGYRRRVRHAIVAAAQKIWEGVDPDPEFLPHEGVLAKEWSFSKQDLTPDTFRYYRDRWAPTSKLPEFLFAPHDLAEFPTEVPLAVSGTGYMIDPTLCIRSVSKFVNTFPSARWISNRAMDMVHRLVIWSDSLYCHKGYGGHVSKWVDAAKKYHLDRFEQDLLNQTTVRMARVPFEEHDNIFYRHLRYAREKAGLQLSGSASILPIPQRPARGSYLDQYSFEDFVRLDRRAAHEEQRRAGQLETFNRLMRHTCQCCPMSGWRYFPQGYEGLMDHMRHHHPMQFWALDDWHSIG